MFFFAFRSALRSFAEKTLSISTPRSAPALSACPGETIESGLIVLFRLLFFAWCERLIGTIRRECLDYVIPLNERHLRKTVAEFAVHYNRGRPHSSLGPGIPEPPQAEVPASAKRHELPEGFRVASTPVLSGLHHEYRLEKEAA